MNINRKSLTNETDTGRGRAIVEWLNREDSTRPNNRAAGVIGSYIVAHDEAAKRKSAPDAMLNAAFATGALGQILPVGLATDGATTSRERMQAALQKRTYLPVNMRAEFRLQGPHLSFQLVPDGNDSAMLYRFGELLNSGNASRLRRCRNCGKFWYCEGRADRLTCSAACKVTLWQKTPEGRKKRAAYMRKNRADHRKLWEAKQRGRTLNRGRKVHVSLKKGE